jgi:hypothetical protein
VYTPDELNALLFVAKQQLRLSQDASADAKKAARDPSREFTPEAYLSVAVELDRQASEKREEIAELEEQRAQLRQRSDT